MILSDQLAEAIGIAVNEVVEARCAALDLKIARMEAAMAEFRFVPYGEGKQFKAGNFSSVGGALFHALVDTQAKPGNGSTDWCCVAARGRDGKDFIPPDLPLQRTVRSGR